MARRRTTPQRLPDAVREAVERTIQTTLGGAQQTRGRAQDALDEVVHGAEAGAKTVRKRVRAAADAARPATYDDIKELRAEVRRLAKRVEALEKKGQRKPAAKKAPASKKRT
jgi:polyhydroxyalkanoate synthesis regulator phasin